jgi:hypothetical protein
VYELHRRRSGAIETAVVSDSLPVIYFAVLTSPGTWTTSEASKNVSVFILVGVEQSCQLKGFLREYISPSMELAALPPGSLARPARILVFGDSVNRMMLSDACRSHRGEKGGAISGQLYRTVCRRPHFALKAIHMPGSSKEGPWHRMPNGSHPIHLGDPYVTIPEVMKFLAYFGPFQ